MKIIKELDNLSSFNVNEIELFIEMMERDVLLKIGMLLRNSLNEFSTYIDRSLGYLDKIILPIVMASKHNKSYNPFAEIIEKYVSYILTLKLEKQGYKFLPLGFSADLTYEYNDHILNIDVKTANLDNPSDFKKTINVGINQFTHIAKIPVGIRSRHFEDPIYVYPTLPPYFRLPDGKIKFILSYGVLFIYPSYKELLDNIRNEYEKIYSFFKGKIEKILINVLQSKLSMNQNEAINLLRKKPRNSRYTREDLITENIIRGIFIHEHESDKIKNYLGIGDKELKEIEEFKDKLQRLVDDLRNKDIKPVAIVSISIPNGLLKEKYKDKFVSGKDFSKSARYHYQSGIFEYIKEKLNQEYPRVLFLDCDKNYCKDIEKYFDTIYLLTVNITKIK